MGAGPQVRRSNHAWGLRYCGPVTEVSVEERRRRKVYALAKELGLSRCDRLDLAEFLLRRDITSWRQLDDGQIGRLLDALEGAQLVDQLRAQQVDHAVVAERDGVDPAVADL